MEVKVKYSMKMYIPYGMSSDAPKTNKATNTPFFKKLNRIHNLLKRKNIMKRRTEQRTCLNGLHTTSYHSLHTNTKSRR